MNIKVSIQGEIETNCYLVSDNKTCYLIDPVEDGDKIRKDIAKAGLTISGVILTHFHLDHIKAIPDFRDCKIYMSQIDYKNLTSPNAINIMRSSFYSRNYMTDSEEEILNHVIKKANFVQVDNEFNFPFSETMQAIITPGHTSGSMCIYFPSSNALFSGDTLFYNSYGRCDLPTGSVREMIYSLKKLSTLKPETIVYPGHGEITSIEHELNEGVLKRFENENRR